MNKEDVKYCVVKSRIENQLRKEGYFYYELRHYDNNSNKYVIEKGKVFVNYYGTMITNKEILKDAEFLDKKHFLKQYNAIKDNSLNPYKSI